MRRARLLYVSQRTILDNLKLHGNDWSFNYVDSSFENGVIYKSLLMAGCLSIDLKEPMVGPWDSVIFEIKAPSDFNVYSNLEINTRQYLKSYSNDTFTLSEDEWTTVEIKYNGILYDTLYDRLDICNDGPEINWFKIRNIYLQPKYKFTTSSKNAKACCTYNQCICRKQVRKVYKRRSKSNSLNEVNKTFCLSRYVCNVLVSNLFFDLQF
ncbi:hypothetical protein BCR32DRAFT_243476 [Anaeromyces robustus]|uniref:Uncharacterized protein n=1 Tax=Anaeromyces robustus TaxID=1754192 RepID=A0A1Y1XC61_9FUNG|nr:hypothetical protein BCR32DRAFT_243476 [Anaeromyces robustus]|eukprot:ORX83328.1 hypothetical protein BCR32DRAFT_243476 [Anaeromyces robustus]